MRNWLLPPPKHLEFGTTGTGWLGSITAWIMLGFSLALGSWSIGSIGASDEACSASSLVCRTAGVGGLVASIVGVALAVLCSHVIARGFGTPVHWWWLPGAVGCAGVGVFLSGTAGVDTVPLGSVVMSLVLLAAALSLVVVVLRQGSTAIYGWVRTDGLSLATSRPRTNELALPIAAFAAASAAAAFGAHVARLLASG